MKLNLRSVDLNLLPVFDAIMTHRKMVLAAEHLNMTQPALSHALGRLRSTLNDELFVRTPTGMQPTTTALALAEPIREALLQIQDTLSERGTFDPLTAERSFRIALVEYGETTLLPVWLQQLQITAPHIKIECVRANGLEAQSQLLALELDFCVDTIEPDDSRLRSTPCANDEWVVVCRAQHPRLKKRITPAQYFRERHIVLATHGERRRQIEAIMQSAGGSREILAEVQQLVAVPALLLHTDAIATLPKLMVESLPFREQLKVLRPPFDLPATPLYLSWHRAAEQDQGIQWIRNLIQKE